MQKIQNMNPSVHYTDCSKEEVTAYLEKVKGSIQQDNFTVSKRNKNSSFFEEYNVSFTRIKSMMLSLTYRNFCWYQIDERQSQEILFVFRLDKQLLCFDELKNVVIYIKTDFIEEEDFTVVISIHESESSDELVCAFVEV